MGRLILLLGGARSGKSSFAEARAKEIAADSVLYVATAETKDEEMRLRAIKHRATRPSAWVTVEAPRNVAQAIRQERSGQRVVLLDCMTVLVSNLLMDVAGPEGDPFNDPSADPFDVKIEANVLAEVEALLAFVHEADVDMFVVSNEVGMGLVPPYELGRAYRDILGRANQVLARHADEVYLLVAGLPMKVK
ncbi:MAG: bifunctional adenosylcobinamide kinase/adenosylcobinamide-phosphate guanylyltransferase [Anaerolineae bacterium]|jgi:adenosylcobinamide kinase/adenosylcobinamide-phosphate guanylyltransferase|nr:bifunctional adenosylcobinamide kinase/adenosylcobinamide-phosphate guanylyltransferase [Anaerolineae bacterium]MBT7072344.1 bifunctional adenosylcobinamide kinase/adenosylcobinamide-phosphate guanylyltransferase [Anaerolineae bacterium]